MRDMLPRIAREVWLALPTLANQVGIDMPTAFEVQWNKPRQCFEIVLRWWDKSENDISITNSMRVDGVLRGQNVAVARIHEAIIRMVSERQQYEDNSA